MTKGHHVLIADDHDLFRQGLRYALLDDLGAAHVWEAGTLDEALAILAAHPEIALASFDIRMPGMRDGESLAAVRRQYPNLPIAVVSGFEDRRSILLMLQYGASGFIPKSLPAADIVTAMRDILAGRIFVPPSITAVDQADGATAVIPSHELSDADHRTTDVSGLTPRQREVLDGLMAGHSTKVIARAMDIAEGTVKVYVAAIFRALDARNRLEAVTKARMLDLERQSPPR